MEEKFDDIDRILLRALQADGTLSLESLAGRADISTDAVRMIPEVVEFYRMAGEVDYLLKVQARSVHDYDRVYKDLIARVNISDVSATFAMECMKNTTELPV